MSLTKKGEPIFIVEIVLTRKMTHFRFVLITTMIIVTGLAIFPDFVESGEMTFQEMVVNLLKNRQIPNDLKKRILTATVFYLQKERLKADNDQNFCPPELPKELCQLPPSFYVWVRKLRDEMIEDEINKSKPIKRNFQLLFDLLMFFLNLIKRIENDSSCSDKRRVGSKEITH